MASLIPKPRGRWIVQWSLGGKRPAIHIGKMSKADARDVAAHIGAIIEAKKSAAPIPPPTDWWIKKLSGEFHAKLVAAKLVDSRELASLHLGEYFDGYIKGRTDLKVNTITLLKQVRRVIVKFFGEGRLISTITKGDLLDWRIAMQSDKLSTATISGHTRKAKQVFQDAADRKLLSENPFANIKPGVQTNKLRQRYIPEESIYRAIDKCPSAEWRLLFAMARFGGVRVPSETHVLKWESVDFAAKRIVIESPKTEQHEGGDRRVIPMFPELVEYLEDVHKLAEDGEIHVFANLRKTGNVRTTAIKIIKSAGLPLWPRLFNNQRASRETDLAAIFPLPVVCAWIGNKAAVAINHYIQVKESDFLAATSNAKSVADAKGRHLTLHEQKSADASKTPVKTPFGLCSVPPVGIESPRKIAEKLQSAHEAMQKTLRRHEAALATYDTNALSIIRRHIDAARGLA